MKKSEALFGAFAGYSLCALVFTLPFSKTMVEVFFCCAFVSWILMNACRYKNRPGPAAMAGPFRNRSNAPIYTFVLIALLSVMGSASFLLSIKGFFFKLLEGVMLYFIVSDVIDSKTRFNNVLIAAVLSMALVGLDGLYQCITGTDFLRGYSSDGNCVIRGPFTSRNSFAGWLVIMIPLAVSIIYLRKGGFFGLSARLLAGVLAICMVLTYSRGALTAVLFALTFFAFLKGHKAMLISMIFIFAASLAASYFMKMRINSMAMVPGYDRIGLWQEALGIIEDFPLLGCGPNTYTVVGPYYKVSGGGGCYPHNSYLQMTAELGLLGLSSFIWIIINLFRSCLADVKKIRDNPYGIIMLGLLSGLFGFLIHSFVDVNIYTLQLGNLMWFVMGLIVSAHKIGSLKPII